MNYETKEWTLIGGIVAMLLFALIGMRAVFNLDVPLTVILGVLLYSVAYKIASYFYSPKYKIAKLWSDMHRDTIKSNQFNSQQLGELVSFLNTLNHKRGDLINATLSYYLLREEVSEEFAKENRYQD